MSLKKLGRYEVIRVLGKGAMGVVYEGRDPNLDRRVAIKTVKVENLSEEAAAEYEHRFRTEARSAARLQHPNIVSVYDSDRDGDVAFLVMEYIQGDDLKHHLDRGVRYSLEQSLKIIRDLLSALDYAHKQGIVHRDIKPANLLIEPGGRVKLTDFGVARIQDSGEATRTQGSMVGTLKYMAPEQVQGQKIDSRADLFSAGVVLYQLLTDKRPFDGDNDFSIIHQIIGHNPPMPTSVNPKLPPAIDAVVSRALAKTREERFATARDFAVALQAAIRRAEDQTVVPPQNPNKKVEPVASRPLTVPGTVPPGGTTPSIGGASSVTQELELVYWKDVKDSSDAEELQGFLEKFPAGIYADLARRRLRKLSGGDQTVLSQPGMGSSVFAATQFPDNEATRMRTDVSRPAVSMGGPAAPVGENGTDLRPANWVDEEYTKTIIQPAGASMPLASPAPSSAPATAPVAAAAIVAPAAASAPTVAPTVTQPIVEAAQPVPVPPPMQPAPAPMTRAKAVEDDEDSVPPQPAKKKIPVAALASVGLLAVAGLLALAMGRSTPPPEGATAPVAATAPATARPAVVTAPAAPPPAPPDLAAPAVTAPPPAAAPVTAAAPAASAPSAKAAAAAKKAASQPTRTAKASVAPEPAPAPRPAVTVPARVDPEPPSARPLPPPVTASASALQAVDQCKDKVFIMRELCLSENCAKAGTRNHPLCIRHREEVRVREESKIRQGPQ